MVQSGRGVSHNITQGPELTVAGRHTSAACGGRGLVRWAGSAGNVVANSILVHAQRAGVAYFCLRVPGPSHGAH
jgi:hypothetical protein